MEREASPRELTVVLLLLLVGGGLFFFVPGIGWKLLGVWVVVGTALVFTIRGNGPVVRAIRAWLRKRSN